MIIYNKKPRLISIKAIIIAIIVAIILYFLPVLTPIVIFALILWIDKEQNARILNSELHEKYLGEIKRFINIVHSGENEPSNNPIKILIDDELYSEYGDKHARNDLQLYKIPEGKNLKEIDSSTFDLWKVKEYYEEIKIIGCDFKSASSVLTKLHNKDGKKLTNEILERISSLQEKKTFNLQDLLNIKDIYDSLLFFGHHISIKYECYPYMDSRKRSNSMLPVIQKLAKKDWIKLDSYSVYYYFWS